MGQRRPNVVFVVMDTARVANATDPHVMPNLNAIAEAGARVTNAFATAPWTLPSHASMFTGQYTAEHGTDADTKSFDPAVPTLAARLQTTGYQTVAVSNNTWVSPEFGFDDGFEEFLVGWELLAGGTDLASISKSETGFVDRTRAVLGELRAEGGHRTLVNALYTRFLRRAYDDGAWMTNYRIGRWLEQQREPDRPFFLFVNYLEPHLQYDPPRRFRERFVSEERATDVNQDAWAYVTGLTDMSDREFETLEALYEAELNYLDHRIGRLYDRLNHHELLEDTVLVLVGDHGENIGDHGLMDHQYSLHDSLLHVPLVMHYPERIDAGTTVSDLVELRDLYPTILDLAGVATPTAETVSTTGILSDGASRERVIAEYLTPQPSMEALERTLGTLPASARRYDRALRSIRTDEWKLIEASDGKHELYRIDEDPDETIDLAAEREDVRDRLCERLYEERGPRSFEGESKSETNTSMAAATRERLDDLGYLQ
ncbi:sulfatase family protein [Halalkalicoccus subterraneus]|uniref:sulfatase family protein n=1 Tax=Halalkalicoccus subterraneus TaxID=2675002 RepID=UPI000EFA7434|nr:sulfatase [Halalkalicoccus subterraneus]